MATTLIDVPQSGQTLGQTRVPIRTNFTVISDAFQVDHVAYNAAGQGKHKWVTFPVQVQATAQAALIYPDIGLYSANYAPTGINELFFRNSSKVPSDTPITASLYAQQGWAYKTGGLIEKWGIQTALATATTVTVDASQGPQIADNSGINVGIISIQISPLNPVTPATFNGALYITGRDGAVGNGNKFGVRNVSGSTVSFYYNIIGTPA